MPLNGSKVAAATKAALRTDRRRRNTTPDAASMPPNSSAAAAESNHAQPAAKATSRSALSATSARGLMLRFDRSSGWLTGRAVDVARGGRVVDIGEAGANEVFRPVVQHLEIVRRMVQM